MTPRQLYALEHPLESAGDQAAIDALRLIEPRANGDLLVSILAVDR